MGILGNNLQVAIKSRERGLINDLGMNIEALRIIQFVFDFAV